MRLRTPPFEKLLQRIDAAYPFGSRDHYPYRAWLMERRAAIARLQGRHLGYDAARKPLELPYVPVPELEDWLRRAGRGATA